MTSTIVIYILVGAAVAALLVVRQLRAQQLPLGGGGQASSFSSGPA